MYRCGSCLSCFCSLSTHANRKREGDRRYKFPFKQNEKEKKTQLQSQIVAHNTKRSKERWSTFFFLRWECCFVVTCCWN